MQKISTQKLNQIINSGKNIHLIDVRTPIEFAAGHLPESINFPVEEIKHFNFPKNDHYFFICHSGQRAKHACQHLAERGYQKLTHISGGIIDWNGAIEQDY